MVTCVTIAGDEFSKWQSNQEEHPITKSEKYEDHPVDILIPVLFPIFFAFFLTLCVFIIPILGSIAFHFCTLIWWLITHPQIRLLGRRILIMVRYNLRKSCSAFLKDLYITLSNIRMKRCRGNDKRNYNQNP